MNVQYHNLLYHSPLGEFLGHFQYFTILNNGELNILLLIFLPTYVIISVD